MDIARERRARSLSGGEWCGFVGLKTLRERSTGSNLKSFKSRPIQQRSSGRCSYEGPTTATDRSGQPYGNSRRGVNLCTQEAHGCRRLAEEKGI